MHLELIQLIQKDRVENSVITVLLLQKFKKMFLF